MHQLVRFLLSFTVKLCSRYCNWISFDFPFDAVAYFSTRRCILRLCNLQDPKYYILSRLVNQWIDSNNLDYQQVGMELEMNTKTSPWWILYFLVFSNKYPLNCLNGLYFFTPIVLCNYKTTVYMYWNVFIVMEMKLDTCGSVKVSCE